MKGTALCRSPGAHDHAHLGSDTLRGPAANICAENKAEDITEAKPDALSSLG